MSSILDKKETPVQFRMKSSVINHLEQDPLQEMLATLSSHEDLFGPYHSQTLRLEAVVAIECWKRGGLALARPLLERSVRDLGTICAWRPLQRCAISW